LSTRSLAASLAANTRWSQTGSEGRRRQSEKMLDGQDRRFARRALDPEGVMSDDEFGAAIAATPPDELAARINAARKAHMLRASMAAARARKKVR
jgi:hypothetical protein